MKNRLRLRIIAILIPLFILSGCLSKYMSYQYSDISSKNSSTIDSIKIIDLRKEEEKIAEKTVDIYGYYFDDNQFNPTLIKYFENRINVNIKNSKYEIKINYLRLLNIIDTSIKGTIKGNLKDIGKSAADGAIMGLTMGVVGPTLGVGDINTLTGVASSSYIYNSQKNHIKAQLFFIVEGKINNKDFHMVYPKKYSIFTNYKSKKFIKSVYACIDEGTDLFIKNIPSLVETSSDVFEIE